MTEPAVNLTWAYKNGEPRPVRLVIEVKAGDVQIGGFVWMPHVLEQPGNVVAYEQANPSNTFPSFNALVTS